MKYIDGTISAATTEAEELLQNIGNTVILHGYVHKIRRMSGFSFVIIRTKRQLVQCVYDEKTSHLTPELPREGSCVIVTGLVTADGRSRDGYELRLAEIEVLTEPGEEYPVAINGKELDLGIGKLLDYRPLTLRNEKERAIFKIQEGIARGFREYLLKNRFTEIYTPKIVSAGAEGGSDVFKVDYFGEGAYLAQSPQFYKQMMVGVFERVFEIGPVYRAEKHDTSRHLNEYVSMDFEMGFITGFEDVMEVETDMLRYIMEVLDGGYKQETELLGVKLPEIGKIPAMKFMEAKRLIECETGREPADFYDFAPEEEQILCDYFIKNHGSGLVFVTHYPSAKRPFYAMDDPADQGYTLSFDLLFNGLEITTGGQRIHNYTAIAEKMRKRGMDAEQFAPYLMLHKYGIPPHGGLGMGLERLTSKLLGQRNVRYSSLFPRDRYRLTP